jgi:hypothetical protein
MKEGKCHVVPLFKYFLVIGPVPEPPNSLLQCHINLNTFH